MRVHVVAGTDELYQKEAGLWLGEAAAAAEHVHERAAVTEFEGHIDVIIVFETFVKADNVGMGQGAVDLDLGVELRAWLETAVGSRGEDGPLFLPFWS